MEKKYFKSYYVVIDIDNFNIRISKNKTTVASIVRCDRSIVARIETRATINNHVVLLIQEE